MGIAAAYSLLVLGVLLVYLELIRPGMILPGAAGIALLCLGFHGLSRFPIEMRGLALCSTAVCSIAAETILDLRWAGGITGTIVLILGSALLSRDGVPLPLAASGGGITGLASTMLARSARRARKNKAIGLERR